MLRRLFVITCCAGAALILPTSSSASVITLDATLRGSYFLSGNVASVGATANYVAGDGRGAFTNPDEIFRNWFTFALPLLSETVVSATLLLDNPTFGFFSPAGTETYTVFNVATTNVASLGTPSVAIFNDLGDGTAYGSFAATSAVNGTTISIALNADALSGINAALGSTLAFGGAITTLDGIANFEFLFGGTGTGALNSTRLRLVTEPAAVPEPTSLVLLGSGLAVAAVKARRRRGRLTRN